MNDACFAAWSYNKDVLRESEYEFFLLFRKSGNSTIEKHKTWVAVGAIS